jgi:hypothetical protein
MKPGDLRIGQGDGEIGGKAFLIIDVIETPLSSLNHDHLIRAIVDGDIVTNPASWFFMMTKDSNEAG